MLKLDRSRAFGTITPAWQPDECDRPAYYEQDGKLFDAHDRQIVPGKPLPVEEVASDEQEAAAKTDVSPYELLRQADVMPWAAFRKNAKAILGDTCPASKADILVALQGAVQHFEQRQQKRKTPKVAEGEQKSAGLTWSGLTGQPDAPENLTAKPAPVVEPGGVDLAAWARGQKEYLFAEIRKTIRAKFGAVVTERDDAVNLLVDNNVITQAEARKDVRRVA